MQATTYKLDFLCVGAEKSGTTWLDAMLQQHPQVCLPRQKELHYFNQYNAEFPDLPNRNWTRPLSWYFSFFPPCDPSQKRGEICPSYLWDEAAPLRIHELSPNAHILIILRNPVERTYSAYRYWSQYGTVIGEFRDAFQKYHSFLVQRSLYYEQVRRYLNTFSPEQVHVYLYDDLRNDPVQFLKSIELTLQIAEFYPANLRDLSNVTGDARNQALGWALSRLRYFLLKYRLYFLLDLANASHITPHLEQVRQSNRIIQTQCTGRSKPEPALRKELLDYFLPDIEKLEGLLSFDLSAWKQALN
ncbi:MAG: sulfotransferase family protein [Chloroflexota bacterium]